MQPFEKSRIEEENVLKKNYALKNKAEVWKAKAKVDYFRGRAKELAKKPIEEQEVLFRKLKSLGLEIETITDILDLKVEDILKRRLATVVVKKKLANTVSHARQLVVHKKILINGKVVSSPSYLVPVAQESVISVKTKQKKSKPAKQEAPSQEEKPTEPDKEKEEEVKQEGEEQ